MRKWQIIEFDDKPYYAFVPENEIPFEVEETPEHLPNQETRQLAAEVTKIEPCFDEDLSNDVDNDLSNDIDDENSSNDVHDDSSNDIHDENSSTDIHNEDLSNDMHDEELSNDVRVISRDSINDLDFVEEHLEGDLEYVDQDIKPIIINDSNKENEKDVSSKNSYQVNVNGRMVTIEKVIFDSINETAVKDTENNSSEIYEVDADDNYESFLENETDPKVNILSKHPGKNPKNDKSVILKCKACLETFSSNLSFRKHVAWTHKKKICIQEGGAFICSVCDFKTMRKASFATHLVRKHETWSSKPSSSLLFPCAACGFVCSSKHSLQSHFIRKHTDKYEHECEFCSKMFKVKGDLTNHVRFHHKEKPVTCDVCGKLCQNSGSLYVHQKWAHFKPKFECHICHRRMVTQENLDQHLITQHEKREKIVCAECGKTFSKKDSFKRHMSVHTGSKPHRCVICEKNFARRSQLRQHLLIHTGKKPFVCDICGKSFTQKPGLICHRKIHPGNHPPLPVMPIGDLVKELTDEFESRREKDHADIDEEFLEGEETINGEEVLEEEEVMISEEILEEEVLEETEVMECQGIFEGQRVFYEHEIQGQEFLDEEEFQEALDMEDSQEID